MKLTGLLLAGLALLAIGLCIKLAGLNHATPFFAAGGSLKIAYVILAIKNGKYKPGYELVSLVFGLILLIASLIARRFAGAAGYSLPVLIIAVALKSFFVISVIMKMRAHRTLSTP